jgi:uncharacterized damage-inducible protein DinB
MPTLPADHAAVILNSFALPAIHAERPVTKAVIAAIPPDKADFRPDPVTRTAIDLAWHIVTAENRFFEAVAAGVFDLTPWDRPASVRTPADINAWYDERSARAVERLTRLSGDELVRIIDFRGLFQFPAVIYLRLGLDHSIHHRGQLSMYLRPMGAKVPSIYGESFDAREAREHAARP